MSTPAAQGARLLAAGELVAFPTETVYGLGADATSESAVAKIFAAKGRPTDHPLIVHFHEPAQLSFWAGEVPDAARDLARSFWPGALTLVLRRSKHIPAAVTGGQDTVALRCPSHPVAQELLREFARLGSGAVAAPSANKFGHVSATTAQHVRDEFGPGLFVIEGGESEIGLESTIVDVSRGAPVLLRPGGITRARLAAALRMEVRERDAAAPRASGTLEAHYAPRAPLVLVDAATIDREARSGRVAILALHVPPFAVPSKSWITAPVNAVGYGHQLYASLRKLDATGAQRILVEAPPEGAAWEAVNDRLRRAAAGAAAPDDQP